MLSPPRNIPTSSSCIMMSAPMECCIEILSSGFKESAQATCKETKIRTVSIVGSPVKGLANSAPSSVIFVNLLSDTSWKPPLSLCI